MTRKARVVLKLGGELLEQPDDLRRVAHGIVSLARHASVVVVHGGGKEIDAAMAVAGIPKRQVDGLRVTDGATLEVVVAVLAGVINTRLVAAVRKAGGTPVGLTGADATLPSVRQAAPFVATSGETVDLGLVGTPSSNGGSGAPRLLGDLLVRGYVPVIACIGYSKSGQLMNVNADTLAAHVASAIGATRLVIAGGTSGVLDAAGATIPRLSSREAAALVRAGTANKGMVAKLQACRTALRRGVGDVIIANGRRVTYGSLAAASVLPGGTQVVR